MSSFCWVPLAILLAVATSGKSESTAFTVIPSHLVDCYKDDGIYHRANRMPSSFESFLDLVRKIEESPTARNMNARELSLALLSYLKQDGIQSIQSHTKYFPNTILPFATSGPEYFKHRLVLVNLVPRIDPSYMTILNETLSKMEMCNLHFMLSYSIDPYKRDNEKCSPLFEKSQGETIAASISGLNFHRSNHGYYRRHKRHIDHRANSNRLMANDEKIAPLKKSSMKIAEKETTDLSSGTIKSLRRRSMKQQDVPELLTKIGQRKKRNIKNDMDKKLDAEEIFIQTKSSIQKELSHNEKDRELLSGNEHLLKTGMQSLVQMRNFEKFDGKSYANPIHSTDESVYSGVIPGIPLSECPAVNGVVSTSFGSLTIGTVITGIAAGLNPEEIPPVKFYVNPKDLHSPSDRLKNIWATTLAGTVADVISSSALLDDDNLQIIKGGWNDSSEPKWYLLNNNQFSHLPEVALRGGLDGLLLGLHAKEWTGKFPGFKLSQMLETYYNSLWGDMGAKYRVQLGLEFAPEKIFEKQVYLMCLVLKMQKVKFVTVLDYNPITQKSVGKVLQHIRTMDDKEKSHMGTFLREQTDNFINMIAVIDSSWGHENLQTIFQILRQAQVASTIGNNLTIICGKDGRILSSSENSADTFKGFTKDTLLENCTRGMDFPMVFDTLSTIYRKIYYEEKISQKLNTDSLVSILFPYEPLLQDNSYIVEKSKNFRSNFPDVRLIVASSGKSESFLPLVKSDKDLFSISLYPLGSDIKSVEEFADGVKQSYQRITRPSCGSYFDDQSVGRENQVKRDVITGRTTFYRLLPQYFYTQHGQVIVTIKSKLRNPLTICHSREMERPLGPTPRGVSDSDFNYNAGSDYDPNFPSEAYLHPYGRQTQGEQDGPLQCKTITSEPYKIEMNDPCEGASSLQECRPLYISLSPPLQKTISIICEDCRLPTNVLYEISVSGLTCYNSASAVFASPFLLYFFIFQFLSY